MFLDVVLSVITLESSQLVLVSRMLEAFTLNACGA